LNGYEVKIPKNMDAEIVKENGMQVLALENIDEGWQATVTATNTDFSNFEKNFDNLEEILNSELEITVKNIKQKKYGNLNVISLETVDGKDSLLIGLTKSVKNQTFEIDICSEIDYDYDTLKIIVNMLENSKYVGKTETKEDEEENDSDYLLIKRPFDIEELSKRFNM